jgi:lysophospholipase L1-like esterase
VPQTKPAPAGDFLSFVQANRRARGETESAESDATAFNDKIAANLPDAAHGVAAQQPIRGGGMFEMKRMTYDDAAFEFFGWNTEMGRRTPQLIEVRRGNNPNMQIAVVRRMIMIIRERQQGDFTWESGRHGNAVTLSARPADNAALENYLLHDMFDDTRDAH